MRQSNESWDLLLDRLAKNAKNNGTKIAIAFVAPGPDGGKLSLQLSYSEVEAQTTELALRLRNSGLKKGDRLAKLFGTAIFIYRLDSISRAHALCFLLPFQFCRQSCACLPSFFRFHDIFSCLLKGWCHCCASLSSQSTTT